MCYFSVLDLSIVANSLPCGVAVDVQVILERLYDSYHCFIGFLSGSGHFELWDLVVFGHSQVEHGNRSTTTFQRSGDVRHHLFLNKKTTYGDTISYG